jgi:hypothetical protein
LSTARSSIPCSHSSRLRVSNDMSFCTLQRQTPLGRQTCRSHPPRHDHCQVESLSRQISRPRYCRRGRASPWKWMNQWARTQFQLHISTGASCHPPSPGFLVLGELMGCRYVRSGFCNTRIEEIYFRYGGRLCHRTTMLTMAMILRRILQTTQRGSRMKIAGRSHRVYA